MSTAEPFTVNLSNWGAIPSSELAAPRRNRKMNSSSDSSERKVLHFQEFLTRNLIHLTKRAAVSVARAVSRHRLLDSRPSTEDIADARHIAQLMSRKSIVPVAAILAVGRCVEP